MRAHREKGSVVASLVGTLLFCPRSLHAEPLPIALSWDAPPECPSRDDVMADLERMAKVRPGRMLTNIQAEAKIERTSDGHYRLHLTTRRDDQRGQTDLDASTCNQLERGATLVLALSLGEGVEMADEKPPPRAPAPPPPPNDRVPSMTTRVAPLALPYDNGPRASAWLAATRTWGLLARPSLGSRLGVGLGWTRWEIWAEGGLWPSVLAAKPRDIDVSLYAIVGAAGGCARIPFGAWSAAACAAFEVGVIHGSTTGAHEDGTAVAPWYAARPSLLVTAPLYGPIKLRFETGVSLSPDSPRFAIRSLGEVARVPSYVPSASVGIAFGR